MAKEKQGERTDIHQKSDKSPINTNKELAKVAGVSTGTVARYQEVKKKAPELVPKIKSGEMTIGGACKAKELDRFSYNANKSPYKRFACRGVIIRFCRKMTVWVNSGRCS